MYSRKIRLLSLNMILVMLLTLIPAQARGEAEIDKNEKKIYTITLDGKDGTLGNENRITVNYSEDNPLSLGNYKFTRAGYTLVGWTKDENNDEWVADRNGIITVDLGYETLYAMWKADDYLEDNVSLVIGGEDKSDLLNSTTECSGTGWTYRSVDDTTSELHLSDGYNGGNIVCKRDNVNIVFDASVSTSQIEVSGALSLTANSTSAAVVSEDSCAIRAKSVAIANTGGIYRIVSNTKTAIEAESLYLASGNVSIEGNPAVSNSLPVTCEEGIAYRSNQNADGLMSGLYSYRKNMTVTLKGNGGTLDGMTEEKIVVYSEEEPLNLRNYPFTRDGYVLVGWSEDATGTTRMFGRDSFLSSQIGSGVLYAVWLKVPESGNYAIFDTCGWGEIPDPFSRVGTLCCVELTDDFKMPVLQKSSTAPEVKLWLWHNADNWSAIYYEGEAFVPKSGMQFRIEPVSSGNGYHRVVFDGNGGTETVYYGNEAYAANKRDFQNFSDGATLYTPRFHRPGHILTGYNTQADGTGTAYPAGNMRITSDMEPVQFLYAQWSPLNLLKNGVRLIIDDDDMTRLLGKNGWSYGTGWRFRDNGEHGTADGQIEIRDSTRYSGGSIAFDGNLTLGFVDGASVGQIEAAGGLTLVNNASVGAQFSVKTNGVAAIRAESVTTKGSAAVYHISAENAVAVDAATLFLDSPNVTIKGDPAVREGAEIDCMEGIGYTRSADKKTLTTYAIDQTLTLVGNGGKLDGKEEMDVTYSAENPLNLRDYPFAWKGYALVGWAADKEGTKLVTDATGHLKQLDDATLYAVWLKVPESNYVILQGSYAGAHATKAGYSSIAMSADGTVRLPEVEQNKMELWRRSDTNEPYFPGETISVPSGTRFGRILFYNARNIIIFDGNGGTMTDTVNGAQCTVTRRWASFSESDSNYVCPRFAMEGYTMTGYKDGNGRFYPGSDISVTADMKNPTILYAQWKKIDSSEDVLWIDGFAYTARENHVGDSWYYYYETDTECGHLSLSSYQGGDIKSDIDLSVSASGGACVVNGSISSEKTLWIGGGSETSSLTVTANEGSALYAKEEMRLLPAYKLTVTGKGAPAIVVTGTLEVGMNLNGAIEATGSPYALSYNTLLKDGYQRYQICGGADKGSAEPVTDDTYNNKPYISYEMRGRVLMLHGVDGVTETGENLYVVRSKSNLIDLGAYSNVFTNAGRRLLGWSRTENPATIDYAAASSTMYCFDWFYELTADLYAVWEGEEQSGVVLKNYGYFDGDRYTYSEQYTAVAEGRIYTLPESSRAGYIFKGWLGSDGNSYAAGDTIEIPTALSFTAQYEVGKITVGGVAYTANRVHGSDALGWRYYPDGYMNYDGRALLYLLGNYSGKPITLDGNLYLSLNTKNNDLTGEEGSPLVSVTGDLQIATPRGDGATLIGGKNAPAIKVGGTLHLSAPVTLIGGEDASAMEVGKLDAECAFLAGESKETAKRAGTYHDEHYFRMDLASPAMFQPGDLVPQMPDTETHRFIGWSVTVDENNSRTTIWYRPGEKITGSEKTLTARYVSNDEGMIFLDGNGAVTAHGARYSDAIVLLPNQASWRYMNADELKAVFHRDGFELTGYKGPDGTVYNLTELNKLSELFDDGQLHMGKTTIYTAQWERIGDKTEDNSAYYTKADDGTVKIESVDQAVLEEQLKKSGTVQIDLSKLKDAPRDVILPVSAVNNVLDLKVEALSIKMADAVVTLDKTAMQSVIEMANSADIQLHVSTDDALSGNQAAIIGSTVQSKALDVSLTANGTEIHNFDGKVTISVPFTWTKQGVLQAWYLADGKKEPVEVGYRDGNAVLTLKHFSTYAVVVKVNDIDETIVSVAGNTVTVNAPTGAVSCVAALYSADGRQMAVGKSVVADDKATVTWKSVDWTKVQTLKVFFLDADDAPIGTAAEMLVKGGAE